MILFKSDWNKFVGCVPDDFTSNETFLRSAALYKSMGVDNYCFMLALHQPILRGVNPFSEDLTTEQKLAIRLECTYNPWYFFREIFRIPNGSNPIMFRSNRGNLSMIWSFFCNVDYCSTQPRQTGKSITADGIKIWLLLFGMDNSEVFLLTKDIELRKKNIKRMKKMMDLLPAWLNPKTPEDLDNTEVITCAAKGNIMNCAVGNQQKDRALNIARGDTLAVTQTDEGSTLYNVHISLPVMMSATDAARDNAKLAGTPYGNIFTSTTGKLNSPEGLFMYNFIKGGMYWDEVLLDTESKEELHDVIIKASGTKIPRIDGTFSHRQLGYSDEWLETKIASKGGDKDGIDRDYYNVWTSGTETSPLSTAVLQAISASAEEPKYVQITPNRYTINWMIEEDSVDTFMRDNHHVLTLDTSQGNGRDANGLTFLNVKDLSITATSEVTEANLLVYGQWIADLLIRYPRTTLIIENQASGQAIIDIVIRVLISVGIDPFTRLYSTIVDDQESRMSEFRDISVPLSNRDVIVNVRYKKYIGFKTNGKSRYFLFDTVLNEAATSTGHLLKHKGLINQLLGLVTKNGRVDHPTGGHDDLCISWLFGHWFLKHSKNLSYYGIDPNECLSLVSSEGAIVSEEELNNRRELRILKIEIAELKDRLMSAPSIIEKRNIECRLRSKVGATQDRGDTSLSLDGILEEVKEKTVSKNSLHRGVRDFMHRRAA